METASAFRIVRSTNVHIALPLHLRQNLNVAHYPSPFPAQSDEANEAYR